VVTKGKGKESAPSNGNIKKSKQEQEDEMIELLKALQLEDLISIFRKEKINIESFVHLSESDLITLGIEMGPRKILINEIMKRNRNLNPVHFQVPIGMGFDLQPRFGLPRFGVGPTIGWEPKNDQADIEETDDMLLEEAKIKLDMYSPSWLPIDLREDLLKMEETPTKLALGRLLYLFKMLWKLDRKYEAELSDNDGGIDIIFKSAIVSILKDGSYVYTTLTTNQTTSKTSKIIAFLSSLN